MRRSTSTVRRACAVGTTIALVGLTTGLGIMTASSASAVEGDTATTSVDQSQTNTPASGPASPDSTAPAPSNADETPAPAATSTPSDTSTDAPAGGSTPDASATATPTNTGGTSTPGDSPAPSMTTAAAPAAPVETSVAITGTPEVGTELKVALTGFDTTKPTLYAWTKTGSATVLSNASYFTPDAALAGSTVTVTVSGSDTADQPATKQATSEVITQTPVFVDDQGQPITEGTTSDDPLYLDTTAGSAFSYTFRAEGSPAPTYSLDWFYADESEDAASIVASRSQDGTVGVGFQPDDSAEGDFTPADQLPEGITFDAATGTLSGSSTLASYYDFAVTATSGDVSTSQFIELTVNPGVAAGISAFTLDKTSVTETEAPRTIWIIAPDGTSTKVSFAVDEDGFPTEPEVVPGSNPTVKQGGTLLVQGQPVDRFGNPIDATDDEGNPTFFPTVTSDVASDVIAPYEENGAEGQGVVGVTFPHASTHTLTVSSGSLQSVSFAVTVVPTVAPVAVVAQTPTGRQLAYTGSDATDALPWALGFVLVGAGLIGARAMRRRQTER